MRILKGIINLESLLHKRRTGIALYTSRAVFVALLGITVLMVPASAKNASLASPPYPPSLVITDLTWAPQSEIERQAQGGDTWPITWADDGNLYTAYGDGNGFSGGGSKLSLGFAKVSGLPPGHSGTDVLSSDVQHGNGSDGKKASGMLMVDGTL